MENLELQNVNEVMDKATTKDGNPAVAGAVVAGLTILAWEGGKWLAKKISKAIKSKKTTVTEEVEAEEVTEETEEE